MLGEIARVEIRQSKSKKGQGISALYRTGKFGYNNLVKNKLLMKVRHFYDRI